MIDGVVSMANAYYDQMITRFKLQRDMGALGMYIANEFIDYQANNKERARRNVETIIDKLVSSKDHKDRMAKTNLLMKKIAEENGGMRFINGAEILQRLEQEVVKYNIDWNALGPNYKRSTLTTMASQISVNPVSALKFYTTQYNESVFALEQAMKGQQLAAEAERDREEMSRRLEASRLQTEEMIRRQMQPETSTVTEARGRIHGTSKLQQAFSRLHFGKLKQEDLDEARTIKI